MTVTSFDTARSGVSLKDMVARAAFQTVSYFDGLAESLKDYRDRRNTAAQLHALSDDMLKDIGLTRGQIDTIASRR